MQVEIKIDKECKEAKLIIITDQMTDELDAIVRQLSSSNPKLITGFRDGGAKILEPDEIYRIYRLIYQQNLKILSFLSCLMFIGFGYGLSKKESICLKIINIQW